MWRWDQGRLLYFQFDVLKSIAGVLVKFDGVKIRDCESAFRKALINGTGMPFLPNSYTVLRNYKRFFESAFLDTVVKDRLIVTDFAKELTDDKGKFSNADDYLLNYINRFRFPFPAFNNYNNKSERAYPFCAIIKLLIALFRNGCEAKLNLDDIASYIIANNCTGFEDIHFYECLVPTAYTLIDNAKRQLCEMIIFISQLSLLKVYNNYLWLGYNRRIRYF
jgi:hypothetical protein